MLMLLLVFLGLQPAPSLPRPLPGNAALPYPESARTAGAEGDVAFRLAVDRTGTVTEVRFTDVARRDVGIEDAFVRTLLTWRFTPAMQAGAAVDGAYEGRVTLEMLMPTHTARMYAVTPAAAWAAVDHVAKDLRLATARRDKDAGLFIGRLAGDVEVHFFVPPDVTPARVYIGSWQDRENRREFNARELNTRFYDALDRHLAKAGEPIPQTPWRRAIRAMQLLPADAPGTECLRLLAAGGSVPPGAAKEATPRLVHEVHASYPRQSDATASLQMVRVTGAVGEDGYFVPLRLEGKSAETTPAFANAAIGAASLWRFRSGVFNGCPVPAQATIDLWMRR
jgi:TonB family protein